MSKRRVSRSSTKGRNKEPTLEEMKRELAANRAAILALEQSNKEKEKELARARQDNAELRKLNHLNEIEKVESAQKIKTLEQKLQQRDLIIAAIESILREFISELLRINSVYFKFVSDIENLDLGKCSDTRLRKRFLTIARAIKELCEQRLHALTSQFLSKSERQPKQPSNIAVQQEEDSISNTSSKWLQQAYEEDKLIREEHFCSEPFEDGQCTHFACNCDKVREEHSNLVESCNVSDVLKKIQEQNTKCATSESSGNEKTYQKDQKDLQSLIDSVTTDDVLNFAEKHVVKFCLSKKNKDNESRKCSDIFDVTEAVDKIANTNYCIIPTETVFEAVCPCCRSKCTQTIKAIPSFGLVQAFKLGPVSVLNPSLDVKCSHCDETYTRVITKLNCGYTVKSACLLFEDQDSLYDPHKEKLADIRQLLSKALSNYEAGAGAQTGEGAVAGDLYAIRAITSSVPTKLNPEEAKTRFANLNSQQQANELRKLGGYRAKDIQAHAHTTHTAFHIKDDNVTYTPAVASLMPAFAGSSLSISIFANLLFVQQSYSSKSAFHKNYLDNTISRNRLMEVDIAFSRALLDPVCKVIQRKILSDSVAIHFDESPVKVACGSNSKGKCRNAYLWAMVSAITSPQQMVFIDGRATRDGTNYLSLIDYNSEHVKFEYAITDGYAGYKSVLTQMQGEKKKQCCCWSHLRRPLHQCLDSSHLLDVYSTVLPKNEDVTNFIRNLEEYCQDKDVELPVQSQLLLIIYYIINMIFSNDATVMDAHEDLSSNAFQEALTKVRTEYSTHLVAALNLLVELYIGITNCVRPSSSGKTYVISETPSEAAKFCLYWMNHRNRLIEFINSASVPLTNNDIERCFRLPAICKSVSLSLKTMDGVKCFANHMTIIENCMLCDVDVREYIPWLSANAQHRINNLDPAVVEAALQAEYKKYPELEKCPPKPNHMPSKYRYETKNAQGKMVSHTLDIYDDANPMNLFYDLISFEGLTPFDYARQRKTTGA